MSARVARYVNVPACLQLGKGERIAAPTLESSAREFDDVISVFHTADFFQVVPDKTHTG